MSWWRSLLDVLIEAASGWGRKEVTKERPQPEPKAVRRPAAKVGKRVN